MRLESFLCRLPAWLDVDGHIGAGKGIFYGILNAKANLMRVIQGNVPVDLDMDIDLATAAALARAELVIALDFRAIFNDCIEGIYLAIGQLVIGEVGKRFGGKVEGCS